jgi:DNA polymerase III delta prime subunit
VSGFADVVGQDGAVNALRAHLARTGGAGSTLILGPEGVGRYKLALATAREILVASTASAVEPANDEALVDSLNHPDLRVLDPGEGIDGVRSAVAGLQRRAARGPRQVLILRDADRLSDAAHNALLKTLEEPPADAAIFVIATDANLLPETVVSRCRVVHARPLNEEAMARLGFEPELARAAQGSPGRAVHLRESGALELAERVEALLLRPGKDPLGTADKLGRKQKGEDGNAQRARISAVLEVVAVRLRDRLPESESALRCVVEALGSLGRNANPGIVLADLLLHPWKNETLRKR